MNPIRIADCNHILSHPFLSEPVALTDRISLNLTHGFSSDKGIVTSGFHHHESLCNKKKTKIVAAFMLLRPIANELGTLLVKEASILQTTSDHFPANYKQLPSDKHLLLTWHICFGLLSFLICPFSISLPKWHAFLQTQPR